MATEKQRRANRLNARRSTGPRTEAGSAFNALKHGLAAQSPVLPHENAAAFHEMRADLIEHDRLLDYIPDASRTLPTTTRRFSFGLL